MTYNTYFCFFLLFYFNFYLNKAQKIVILIKSLYYLKKSKNKIKSKGNLYLKKQKKIVNLCIFFFRIEKRNTFIEKLNQKAKNNNKKKKNPDNLII